ncbi:MAG TPA: PRC-barrel domain-containing protein [Microvirga sp.]|nr:PRC-barrel domain-containing protein [Microvirga sp.]
MLTRVAIGLLAGTLLSAPVLAQTGTSPSTTAPAQGQQMNQSTQPMGQGSQQMNQGSGAAMQGGGNIQYITQSRPDMWRASQLDGVNVYNQNNERIGEVDDVLVDKSGRIEAVVIGVGGFLGIGERRVAVPFNALQWQMQEQNTAANTTTGTTGAGGAGMGAGGSASGTAGSPATTGTVGGGGAGTAGTGTAGNQSAGANNDSDSGPARAILANATKEQLQQAPEFKYGQ